jgi:hypothetical protein
MKVSLNRTLPISMYYCTHKVFKSHVTISQADLLYSSVLLVSIRSELTVHGSRYIATDGHRPTVNTCHAIAIQPVYGRVGRICRNTASSTVACWTVFTDQLSGNALIKSVTLIFHLKLYVQSYDLNLRLKTINWEIFLDNWGES